MDAAAIAKVAFTSEDRVRDVIRNFDADGFSSLYPKYCGGRPPEFLVAEGVVDDISHAGPAGSGSRTWALVIGAPPFSVQDWVWPKLVAVTVSGCHLVPVIGGVV